MNLVVSPYQKWPIDWTDIGCAIGVHRGLVLGCFSTAKWKGWKDNRACVWKLEYLVLQLAQQDGVLWNNALSMDWPIDNNGKVSKQFDPEWGPADPAVPFQKFIWRLWRLGAASEFCFSTCSPSCFFSAILLVTWGVNFGDVTLQCFFFLECTNYNYNN